MLPNIEIKVPTFTTVNVTTAGVLVLAANTRRFYAIIQNNSNRDIWIMLGSQNAVGEGILVPRNGFSFEIDRLNLWQGSVYAIHDGVGNMQMNILDCQ